MNFLITGVSSGLGEALTRRLLSMGHNVLGVSRRECRFDDASDGSSFSWMQCDVGDEEDVKRTLNSLDEDGYSPDVIILNAGIHIEEKGPLSLDICEETFNVNCRGALMWVEHYLPKFLERESGHFALISSLSAFCPLPYRSAYSASKSYVSSVFGCMRRQHAGSGVKFTTIYAGLLDTQMAANVPVPGFLKYPVEKAVKIIVRAIKKRRSVVAFPLRNILLDCVIYIMPDTMLLKRLGHNQP